MSENNLYYIYIDSKIEGTIDQLMSYFQANVLHGDDCICVYFKFYKEIEKYIQQKFAGTAVRFKFIKRNSDLIFTANKAVLYLFNAQSNCKITARRDLTHIFVTHGESHKLASIKPIIRIYDFVLTSGQLGIERFFKAGIFNQEDLQREQRIIAMGDTFIGQNAYHYAPDSRSLLYAPTWEGGVPHENYSSIGAHATEILIDLIEKNNIQQLYLQPHPNLGHRDSGYQLAFKHMVNALKKLPIELTIVKIQRQWRDYWCYRGCQLTTQNQLQNIALAAAVVDISAMEMQLLNKHIPTLVLFDEKYLKQLIIPKRIAHLYAAERDMHHDEIKHFSFSQQSAEIKQHQDYLIGYHQAHLATLSFRARIQWLCEFTHQQRQLLNAQNVDAY